MWVKHFLMDAAGDGSGGGSAGGNPGAGASGSTGNSGDGSGTGGSGQAQGGEFGWLGATLDAETVGYVQNKGWKEPKHVFESYRALEKLFGSDRVGRTVTIPKADATPEERAAFFSKLGRPESVDGYGLDKLLPKDADPTLAKEAAGWFHEAGLTPDQAKAVAGKWNAFLEAQMTARNADIAAKTDLAENALKKEWGAAYEQNVNIAKQAAKAFGFSAEAISALEQAVGYDGVHKLLHTIGSKIGEADFVSGNGGGSAGGKMTPEQAKAEISALRNDKEFVKRYTSGDLDAKKRMADLHAFAYPDA